MNLRPLVLSLAVTACQDYDFHKAVDVPEGEDTACALGIDTGWVAPDPGCVVEPEVGTFNPVIEWQWNASGAFPGYDDIMATPVVGNLSDDNGDGRIDADDIPDIVFTTFAGGGYTAAGTLTALSGDGTGELWSLLDAGGVAFYASGTPAIGDLDGDGLPEVCVGAVGGGVVCVTNEGAFRWQGGTSTTIDGAPAIADIDGDGQAEVVWGYQLLDTDGTLLWTGAGGSGWILSFAVDLDADGVLEIIAGNTAYNADGSIRWQDGTGDGPGAVGDFDLDGVPEIVHVVGGPVVTGADGIVWWSAAMPGGGGGPPTVADFDGDGYPEIGIAGAYSYTVFDTDGSVLWSASVQDYSSSVTGSSVFDFEGDGAADVVYGDEVTLWVYDGATGAVKFQMDDHASGTLLEYPLIVDVDNDGSTEIVVASNNYAFTGWNGITVIGDADQSWRPSRPIWNQYAYFITNVNDDGSIPTYQEPNWTRYNNFRAGGTTLGLSNELADLQALTPNVCLTQCNGGAAQITVPIRNVGLADSVEFVVEIYASSGGAALGRASLSLRAGEQRDVGPFLFTADQWSGALYARIDDADVVEECDEADNILGLGEWPCE